MHCPFLETRVIPRIILNNLFMHISMFFVFVRYMSMYLTFSRPDSSQNFMDKTKTADLTHLCVQIKNTVLFFNHTHIKPIKNFKISVNIQASKLFFLVTSNVWWYTFKIFSIDISRWKWNPWQDDNSNPVYVGTKSCVNLSIHCK